MHTDQITPATLPEPSAALQQELALLDWIIEEAKQAHDIGKAHAERNGKPFPLSALRIVVQAHNRKMALLGFGPIHRSTSRKTAQQLAADVTETRNRLSDSNETNSTDRPKLNRAQRRALERSQSKKKAA